MNDTIKSILRLPWKAGTAIVLLWNKTEAGKALTIKQYTLHAKNLPKAFDGCRIVQLADLHGRTFGPGQSDLLQKVQDLHPDLVLSTGDMFGYRTRPKDLLPVSTLFRRLKERYPVYAILGNHETRDPNVATLIREMENTGITLLRNESTFLDRGEDRIALAGLETNQMRDLMDKESEQELRARMDQTFADLRKNPSVFTILMGHKPELISVYSEYKPDLVFSGHAHGGLLEVPYLQRRLLAPGQGLFPKYTEGLYLHENSLMVVSTGLGGPRFRITPEITVVTLKKS